MHSTSGTAPSTVLFADDDDVGRSALSRLLRHHGFEVWEAETGREALRRARECPDLVLLDVHLPDASGFDLCRQIKADPATCSAPVLLISGLHVHSRDRVSGLDGGADGYLTKPVEPDEVVAQIRALLRVRHAEDNLRRSEARFRALIEKSFEAVVLLDADGIIRYASPATVRVLGYQPEELRDTKAFDIVHHEDRPSAEELFARQLRAPETTIKAVFRGRCKDGSWRWLEAAGTNLLHDPDVRAVVANFHDVTERRRLEEQLRQAQKQEAVGRLAGGIAHDFNNLLTVIGGFAELVQGQLAPEDKAHGLVGEIQRAADRAAALTRQLLAFGRKQILQPRVLDLNSLVSGLGQLIRRLVGEDVILAIALAPSLGRVKADPGQVEQVLVNLAVNARDAMPRGGRLAITTEDVDLSGDNPEVPSGPYVLLTVTDSGCGMTAQVQAHVFEPFFTTKPVGKGTGLGLATVYGVVKQSGGHVEFSSQIGTGTTFRIFLPRVEETPRQEVSQPGLNVAPHGSETILVAEDETTLRAMVCKLLEGLSYRVLAAPNGSDALRLAEEYDGPIHLLLSDVVMPVMGGRELAERLTASRPGTKVLFVSGHADDAVVRHGIQEAEVCFLQKPFSPLALAQLVRSLLDSHAEASTDESPRSGSAE